MTILDSCATVPLMAKMQNLKSDISKTVKDFFKIPNSMEMIFK